MLVEKSICILVTIAVITFPSANTQSDVDFPVQDPFYIRDVQPAPTFELESFPLKSARFFATVTVTLATSTYIYTLTTTTTCTTSTTAIKVCSPSKGRRRRQNFGIHRLKFDEDDYDTDLFFDKKQLTERMPEPSVEHPEFVLNQVALFEESENVPFVVQPGFSVPDYADSGRFLIAFGTATTITTTTSTYSYTLTATCKSTTGYQTCGASYGRDGYLDESKIVSPV